jgi:hypothetical protein
MTESFPPSEVEIWLKEAIVSRLESLKKRVENGSISPTGATEIYREIYESIQAAEVRLVKDGPERAVILDAKVEYLKTKLSKVNKDIRSLFGGSDVKQCFYSALNAPRGSFYSANPKSIEKGQYIEKIKHFQSLPETHRFHEIEKSKMVDFLETTEPAEAEDLSFSAKLKVLLDAKLDCLLQLRSFQLEGVNVGEIPRGY